LERTVTLEREHKGSHGVGAAEKREGCRGGNEMAGVKEIGTNGYKGPRNIGS